MSKRSTSSPWPILQRWRRAAIGLLLLGGSTGHANETHAPPPAEAATESHAAPIDRVASIRRQLLDQDAQGGVVVDPPAETLAQWSNWRNTWANWGNA